MTNTTNTAQADIILAAPEPRDLHALKPWLNVVRRLRSMALDSGTYSVVSIAVLVDDTGKPIVWTEPKARRLEPRANGQAVGTLVCALGE